MRPRPLDFDAVVAMKELSLQRELEKLEAELKGLSGLEWQIEYDLYRAVRKFKVKAFEHFGRLYCEPPIMKHPILPATVSDWDFNSVDHDLDVAIYRSAPSSLRFLTTPAEDHRVGCNYAGTTNLGTGRISSWIYKAGTTYDRFYGFLCRLQYPTWDNCYSFRHGVKSGVGTWAYWFYEGIVAIKEGNLTQPPCNTWFLRRLTWWTSGGWFILRFERWTGAEWVNDVGDCIDQTPSWGTGDVNRCGLRAASHASIEQVRMDDTTIYGP